jgi:SAM-dependent methyltransferase
MIRRLDLPDTAALARGGPDTAALVQTGDVRQVAPSAERNAAPILAALTRLLPETARVLELASGTGQHAAQFCAALPRLDWQPSDGNTAMFPSIRSWSAGLPNLRPPVQIDAGRAGWAVGHTGYDVALVVNLLHLISASEARNTVTGMAETLAPGGIALVYGPFRRDGQLTSAGDAAFDASLRAQDPAIGYKDRAEVVGWALAAGLRPDTHIEMPANNLMLVFRRPVQA